MKRKTDEKVQLGRTPEGQVSAETPAFRAPDERSHFWGSYGYWLGDPDRRYGRLVPSRAVPAHIKLEMLRDPVIAMCMGFVSATLVEARRVIECTDEKKRRFFEAMFREWEQEFILQACMAIALGSCGLIKRFEFRAPEPQEIDADPVWTLKTTPYILTGFDACYPVTSRPRFDDKRRKFQGMDVADGQIDVFYSLWLTLGQARAFGAYEGSGRLETVYHDWWMKKFARDLYLVYLQKNINPGTKAGYPPGKTDGKNNVDIALSTGDAARSGTTVAIPTDVYTVHDEFGEEHLSNVRKWTLDFMESGNRVAAFHTIDDHHDRKIALGLLVPPQALMDVTGGDLGGPTSADKLTELAEKLLLMEASDLDRHLNDYAFPAVERANFPPGSARVRVRTVGLAQDNRRQLFEIVKILLGRQGTDATVFNLVEALERLGMPVNILGPETKEKLNEIANRVAERWYRLRGYSPEQVVYARQAVESGLAGSLPPIPPDRAEEIEERRKVLEDMVKAELTPVPEGIDISEGDIRRAVRRLQTIFPEVFEK